MGSDCEAILERCHLYMNTAQHGCGIHVADGKATMIESSIHNNAGFNYVYGAGLSISGPNAFANLTECEVHANVGYVGYEETKENGQWSVGGGLWVGGGAHLSMSSCNLYRNLANKGGGLYIEGTGSVVDLTGCRLFENDADDPLHEGTCLYACDVCAKCPNMPPSPGGAFTTTHARSVLRVGGST